jgi:hypothetical protein
MHDPVAAVVFGQPVKVTRSSAASSLSGRIAMQDERKLIEKHNKAAAMLSD